ncbi:hypothetical protein FBU30_002008 [Linnemannia zychae]|nr:hypothetical protein FBU30_002008 [Linnemannia zychae]
MPFPNVTSHRRMPHLPNSSKTNPTGPQVPIQQDQQSDNGMTTLPDRDPENGSSSLRLTAAATGPSPKLLQENQSVQHPDHNIPLLPTSVSSSSLPALSGGEGGARITSKDNEGGLIDQDRLQQNEAVSPMGGLSLSSITSPSTSTSPSLTTHDSKMIKTALHDAFGILYHPSAHTKHSLSTTAAALRSGDVTPLMGVSPKASPLLRPQYLGASAPITPLELSEEGSAVGYFGLHLPTTSSSCASTSSVAITGTNANNSAAGVAGPSHHGHGQQHHHHYHQHQHHHHPHRHIHTSSHLSATFINNEGSLDEIMTPLTSIGRGYRSPLSRSRRASIDPTTFDPTEHPVLSSLQTLSLTHPHPPEHYHPHLGHTLGHDRVSIGEDSPAAVEHASSKKPATTSSATLTTSSTATTTAMPSEDRTALQHRTDEQQHSSSPFPMDRGDHDSISGFGQQGLV